MSTPTLALDEERQADASPYVEQEGYLWDPATGECMGPAGVAGAVAHRFEVTDLQSAAWVLRKRHRALQRQADLRAVMEREIAEERARIEHDFEQSLRRAEQAVGWWAQYEPQLRDVTMGELAGGKARSVEVGGVRMGFRRKPARIDVLDEHLALAWARTHLPDAIAVKESVLKTPLKGHEAELPDDAFAVVEAEDRFYIEEA